LILVVLLWMHRRRRFEGQVILAYAILYSVGRFIIEFWRNDPRGEILNLSTSQIVAIILFAGALPAFIYRLRKRSAEAPAPGVYSSHPAPQPERAVSKANRRAALEMKKENTETEITEQAEGAQRRS
jgi:prolipoprotein diacylglyceryltransferase